MAGLTTGAKAPDFRLPTDDGGSIALSELSDRKVAIFFYPKADTSGCTLEAKDFNRLRGDFDKSGTVILGVSADPVPAQARFKSKYGFSFALASDPTHAMLESYGVWTTKSMFGRKYMGIERTTILIDRSGGVARIWSKVRVAGHASEVLAAAQAL